MQLVAGGCLDWPDILHPTGTPFSHQLAYLWRSFRGHCFSERFLNECFLRRGGPGSFFGLIIFYFCRGEYIHMDYVLVDLHVHVVW